MLLYFPEHKIKFVKIPKNACSTVINTLGWSVTQDRSPHQFDKQFRTTGLDTSDWPCVAVLRDPYERLISAYLDKVISPHPEKQKYAVRVLNTVWRNRRKIERPSESHSIKFSEFVEYVCARKDDVLDQHWQSQSHHIGDAAPTIFLDAKELEMGWNQDARLREIEFKIFAPHATDTSIAVDSTLVNCEGHDLAAFRRVTKCFPQKSAFANERLQAMVARRYSYDYALRAECGFQNQFVTTTETASHADSTDSHLESAG